MSTEYDYYVACFKIPRDIPINTNKAIPYFISSEDMDNKDCAYSTLMKLPELCDPNECTTAEYISNSALDGFIEDLRKLSDI
jgi:hypothetical protein